MARHTLGLHNGQVGLGLVRETNTAAAAAGAVPAAGLTGQPGGVPAAPAPPLPGLPQEVLTPGGQVALPALAPKQPSRGLMTSQGLRIDFEKDPLRSMALILSEFAAGFSGTEGPIAKSQAAALQQQGLKLRTQAAVLDGLDAATKTIPRLKPDQIKRYAENFPDIEGTGLKATVKAFAAGELEGLDETIARLKADPFAVMFMGSLDMAGKSPAEVKAVADKVLAFKAELQGKQITEEATREGKAKTEAAKTRAREGAKGDQPKTEAGKAVFDRELVKRQFGADSPQLKAFEEAAGAKGAPSLSDERGIRQEFTKLSGDFIQVRDGFAKVKEGAAKASAAGDVALVFNFMKVLDPGSVVREGEFALAAAAAGLSDRIVQLARRVDTGERLTPDQRADFLDVAGVVFQSQVKQQRRLEESFRAIAKRSKVDAKKVVIDFVGVVEAAAPTEEESAAAAVKGGGAGLPGTAAELGALSDEEVLKRLGIR